MPEVDPDDDTIWRWVIYHLRYDPVRKQRRQVVVAAYDNATEFEAEVERYQHQVQRDSEVDGSRRGREQVSGTALHPGYRAEHALAHAARRAIEHGVSARRLLAGNGQLPSNVAVFGVDEEGCSFSFGGGEPPTPPGDADVSG